MVLNPLSVNLSSPISRNAEPDPNVTEASDLHRTKAHSPITSTDAGMTTLFNPLSANIRSPISRNAEPDSNATVSSDLHSEKQECESTLTLRGRKIVPFRFPSANASSPIRGKTESDSNVTLSNIWFL
jgi:hypothetical protein